MKMKLLHIALGNHNDGLWSSFEKHFETKHYNWVEKEEKPNEINSDIVKIYNQFKPDVVFMQIQREGIIDIKTAQLMTKNSFVANWTGDVRYPLPKWFVDLGKHISVSLFSNMFDVQQMMALGVNSEYLQVGFDPKVFHPFGNEKPNNEIVFMGSNYVDKFPLSIFRQDLVMTLKSRFPNQFKAYGMNWKHITGDEQFLNVHEESYVYRNSLMAINLSHFNYDRYSSDRIFRMIGSGAFCLSHEFKNIENDFKINEHLVTWTTFDELVEKIIYYQNNKYEREKIRMQGCRFVRENCTWDKRIEEFKGLIN